MEPMDTTTAAMVTAQEDKGHELRHAQPRFDYAIGKDVQDHHFTHTAKPLSGEEAERLKALGLNNPVGHHMKEGLISHSAQRALLRSLDHANNAHEAEAMELAALMGEFDALVQECGAMQTSLEHERYETALDACVDLRTRLITLQAHTKHALTRAQREAALWRGAEHKKEAMMMQQQHPHAQPVMSGQE